MKLIIRLLLFLMIIPLIATSCRQENSSKTRKVLTLGIRNESNTFSTLPTREADFTILRGSEVLTDQLWAAEGEKRKIEFIPTVHAYAWPGGVVEQGIFDRLKAEILESIRNAGPLHNFENFPEHSSPGISDP